MSYRVEEIHKGIYKISSRLGVRYVHQYVLINNDNAIIIDAGMKNTPEEAIIPALKEIGVSHSDISAILISHADVDHFAGVNNLKSMLNQKVTVMAHKEDVKWIENKSIIEKERYFYYEKFGVFHKEETKQWFQENLENTFVDIHLNGGEVIQLGENRYIDILHTPGHTQGHLSFIDRKNKTAIVVDAILWKGLYDTAKKIVSPPPYYMIEPYIQSIEKINELKPETILTGHYDPLYGIDATHFLKGSKLFVRVIEEAVIEAIRNADAPLQLDDILSKTNEQVGPFTEMMVELTGPIYAHLKDLEYKQMVKRIEKQIPSWEII